MGVKKFPFYFQLDRMDCGPTCLRMVAKYYGKAYSGQTMREKCAMSKQGSSLLGISDGAEKIGIRTFAVHISFQKLKEAPLPCIVHWQKQHFVVVYKIKNGKIHIADPNHGLVVLTEKEFTANWIDSNRGGEATGVCLLMEPTHEFYNQKEEGSKTNFWFLFSYLRPYKSYMIQLAIGLLFGSVLQLIFPFLTQSIVDYGINNQNIHFIYLVLIAQFVLFLSRISVEFIRTRIFNHISTRISISLVSDFLIKIMKLPMSFFDAKMIGDIMQRITDHRRIESYITSSSLGVIFSLFNLITFSFVLAFYNLKILAVYAIGSTLYVTWLLLFMKKRRDLDYKRFSQMAQNQSNVIRLIEGMQEIKLNNCEKQKRWGWEQTQAKIFKVQVDGITLQQYQQGGSSFIKETQSMTITFLSALSVINGEMTLGMMLAVQYVIGQLNGPLEQMMGFFQATQDAKISLERLTEVHNKKEEEPADEIRLTELPENKTITINNLSFSYGADQAPVLKNINISIPEGKVTAIVGTSGSGKTTLLKLLLGFYPPTQGNIKVGQVELEQISIRFWRRNVGAVMQDGYVFSDTIANNVSVSDEVPNKEKLKNAVTVANIKEYIESLPLGYDTMIGADGNGLSQGQKQRMLIARAVYKNPQFLLFDEATNSLDANNERTIMENMNQFFKNRTAIVVAHRLSTVKNADQIIVLEKGVVVEVGTHADLTEQRGLYYQLVKNQLELGN